MFTAGNSSRQCHGRLADVGQANKVDQRLVSLGPSDGEFVAVLKGVSEGDRYQRQSSKDRSGSVGATLAPINGVSDRTHFAPKLVTVRPRATRPLQRKLLLPVGIVRACAGDSAPWAHDVQPLTIVGKWHGASSSSSKRIGKSVGRQPITTIHS